MAGTADEMAPNSCGWRSRLDGLVQRVDRLVPQRLELRGVRNEHLLAEGAIRVANRLLLARQQVVEVLGRAVRLTEDGHHLEDVDVHALGLDEVQLRRRFAPHVLELEPLRLEQRVDQVEDVETDPLAVDLREDVADLVELEFSVQLDVGDLVLLGDPLQVLAKRLRIVGVARCAISAPLHRRLAGRLMAFSRQYAS